MKSVDPTEHAKSVERPMEEMSARSVLIRNRQTVLWIRLISIFLVTGWMSAIPSVTLSQQPTIVCRVGKEFDQELEQPLSANWSKEGLRPVLAQIESSRRVSILLDRRIDPSIEHRLELSGGSLRAGLSEIARNWNAQISTPSNVVYFGPPFAAEKLRSLIQLRNDELVSKENLIPVSRRSELQSRRSVKWNDLDTAREIVTDIASAVHLTTNVSLIPHDLFVAAELPAVTAVEALSLVLIQFDLTFEWTDGGKSINLVPIPRVVLLERRYRSTRKATEVISKFQQQFPDIDFKFDKNEIVVRAFLEQHEALARLFRQDGPARSHGVTALQPIQQRQFTFSANQPVPIRSVIEKLEESGIHFEYDKEQLADAGIDLDQRVEIDVKNATAKEFLQAIFGKSGIEFQFDQDKVKLKPKDK